MSAEIPFKNNNTPNVLEASLVYLSVKKHEIPKSIKEVGIMNFKYPSETK